MNFRTHFAIWLIGCISGISIVLTGSTLNFWLAKEQISTAEIGMFSLVALPYCINFIWSPILDKFYLPILSNIFGHKLSWILVLQVLLSIATFCLSNLSPLVDLWLVAIVAFSIALLSSTNDNLLSALRSEFLDLKDQGPASGTYVFGYRIGMLMCNSGAIYLSTVLSWQHIYRIVAVVFLFLLLLLILAVKNQRLKPLQQFHLDAGNRFIDILKPMGSFNFVLTILLFLILYRLADNFIYTMINPFLLDLQFNVVQIATAGKLFGSLGTIIGGVAAGYIMRKMNIIDSLWYFGLIHTSAHVFLIAQAIIGNNLTLYFFASISESITGGMAMAAYIAFITSICRGRYKTTQQAIFTSMMGMTRSIFPSVSGIMASYYGWTGFFSMMLILSMPGLILLYCMRDKFSTYLYGEKQL
jgi:PAT family beta-lactamase induction signal transducer AmpG